jgi:HK97 family phage major capsid protein
MSVLNASQQEEIRTLTAEADAISQRTGKITEQEKTRFNFILSRISAVKSGAQADTRSREELQAAAKRVVDETAPYAKPTEVRSYLLTGKGIKESRTYTGMNLGTDSAGGFFVPQDMSTKVWTALKQQDRLFDPEVVSFYETDHGNALTVPMTDDTGVSAVIVAENAMSAESEIGTIDRVSLGKVPTWRSKKLIASLELIQDSAFPIEDLISANAARRFSRGIGAANVATLIAGSSSGATSQAAGAVSYVDLMNLLGSVDPSYLASPKCFFAMQFSTLIALYSLKDSTGRPIFKPQTDSNGNFLLLTKPVAITPSMDALTVVTGKPIALGDFSRFLVRTVKGYPQVSIFNGSGDANFAENYHCEDRSFRWAIEGMGSFRNPPKTQSPDAKRSAGR